MNLNPSNNKPQIILLDNNELFGHFRQTVLEVCELLGYEVELVKNTEALQRQLTQGKFKLMIVDHEQLANMKMPHALGLGAVPLVTLVDLDDQQLRDEARQHGCAQLLARHYSEEEIAYTLKELLLAGTDSGRKHQRVLSGLNGNVVALEQQIPGTIVNISEGGAFIKCFTQLQPGMAIDFEIQLPKGGGYVKLLCRSRVVYVKPYLAMQRSLMIPGIGLEFLESDNEEQRKLLADYIRNRRLQF